MAPTNAWAIIAGVGPGIGASVARKFASQYAVALLARSAGSYEPIVEEIKAAGGKAIGISTDISDAKNVAESFEVIKKEMGSAPLAAAVYNVGGSLNKKAFLDLKVEEFEAGWTVNGRGSFLFGQHVIPLLTATTSLEHPPTLIFTSATAAMKGSALCASFSGGKFAMRSLAQSLAREFGPKGVHVAHAIIDGVVEAEETKDWLTEHPDAKLQPGAIADTYWYLHTQSRTCFTNELDLRPYIEKW